MVLRDEGAHRGGRGHGAGAQRRDDGGQRGGYHASAAAPAWGRDARVGRRGVRGRGPAPGAPGPAGRLAGGAAAGAAAALGARQRRRPGGAAQGLDSREGGASVPVCEAPLRLRAGAVSGIGQEPDPALRVAGVRQSAAGGARRAGASGRSAPRAGAHPACTATWRRPQLRDAVHPTPPGALPLPWRSGAPVVQSFPK